MSNLSKVILEITKMNSEEINSVVSAIKDRRTFIARSTVLNFEVGDKVEFDARGSVITGTITKKAIKNITVDTGRGKWRVSATLLRKAA
ncbi:uncharacterized protein METZ01_LOCUS306780 [marine metagenome]|uniref:Uncharacterized protein n=1 Tax=marine metagenome TaxID=408172 RepID=A0A382MYS1_9ZZZZ